VRLSDVLRTVVGAILLAAVASPVGAQTVPVPVTMPNGATGIAVTSRIAVPPAGALVQAGGTVVIIPPGLTDAEGDPITTVEATDLNFSTTGDSVTDPSLGGFVLPPENGTVLGALSINASDQTGQGVSEFGTAVPFFTRVITERIRSGTITNETIRAFRLDPTTGAFIPIPADEFTFDVVTGTAMVFTNQPGTIVFTQVEVAVEEA
jgi:hypothetical protein